jgi:hypothetical protein
VLNVCLLKVALEDRSRLICVDRDLQYQVLVNMNLETAYRSCIEKKTASKIVHGSKFDLALMIYRKEIQDQEHIVLKICSK